jgi:predicted Rossmann-fold nucleotide-binding protein
MHFFTPSTPDGRVVSITFTSASQFECIVEFDVDFAFRSRLDQGETHPEFCARSRICRLGISLTPHGSPSIMGNRSQLTVSGRVLLSGRGIEDHLQECLVPGVAVGRLIARDESCQLSAAEVFQEIESGGIRLPNPYSLGSQGDIHFQPQLSRYDFRSHITRDQLFAILARHHSKELLNFLQIRVPVSTIVLEPDEAVITSCAMFLHQHYLMLDTGSNLNGQHLHANVLDPIETRTSRVFLEFHNSSASTVVNPAAAGRLYRADSRPYQRKSLIAFDATISDETAQVEGYKVVSNAIERISSSKINESDMSYVFFQEGEPPLLAETLANRFVHDLGRTESALPLPRRLVQRPPEVMRRSFTDFEARLSALPGKPLTLFSEYFPNLTEHPALLRMAAAGTLRSIVFQNASSERGPFFSERDHARMSDYLDFGVEIFWCNSIFSHIAKLCLKDQRSFFVPQQLVEQFSDALVMAVYGSTVVLDDTQAAKLVDLLGRLDQLFGGTLSFLTGGGSGVMDLVLRSSQDLDCMVGCNFLENADQNLDATVSYYQTFQASARHMRQRWFEIARFHLFCIGGVGTLEEMGLTLTDIKLGLLNREPIVFFGAGPDGPYWHDMVAQLRKISRSGRGPNWLETNILATDHPSEVIDFYKRVIQIA